MNRRTFLAAACLTLLPLGAAQAANITEEAWGTAQTGEKVRARALFEKVLSRRNHLGLLSEDVSLDGTQLWGNFPQTYSMVGLIQCAARLSISWEEAY